VRRGGGDAVMARPAARPGALRRRNRQAGGLRERRRDPRADRRRALIAAAAAAPFRGRHTDGGRARKLLRTPDAVIYDNAQACVLCVYKRGKAFSHRDGARNTPTRLDRCVPGCGNIAAPTGRPRSSASRPARPPADRGPTAGQCRRAAVSRCVAPPVADRFGITPRSSPGSPGCVLTARTKRFCSSCRFFRRLS
jgi:hypothetical protein